MRRAALSLGSTFFCQASGPGLEAPTVIQVVGCGRQPLQGKSTLQLRSEGWTPLRNYSSSGEILILDNSPGKGGGWSHNALEPPDLPRNLESLVIPSAQLAWRININPSWNESPFTQLRQLFPNPDHVKPSSFPTGPKELSKIYIGKTSMQVPGSLLTASLCKSENGTPLR